MQLDLASYRDKVKACWIGKNIGGTMGTPYEHMEQVLDISGFATAPGEVLPNDDLDLQLVWLFALERVGPLAINAATLGEYWLSFITPYWNEYGTGKANLRRGLTPPLSGDFENNWSHSNGAWIRTEIWACTTPGIPQLAAKYAVEDAKVDHGSGEGTFAAAFVAAMQAAAFVVSDLRKCIDIGLAAIPADCRMAESIRLVMDCYDGGKSWLETRNAVQQRNQDIGTGWFEAPSNVAFAVLGMLYGEGDFKKSMITAINCGDDTDCTGATVGATLGILHGMACIPADWMEYIGDDIVTISIALGSEARNAIPKTCTELTERVVALAPAALFFCSHQPGVPAVCLGDGSDIPEDIAQILLRSVTKHTRTALENLKPYTMHFTSAFLQADLTLSKEPLLGPGEELGVHIILRNNKVFENMQHPLSLRWLLPEGYTVSCRGSILLQGWDLHNNGTVSLDAVIRAGDRVNPQERIVLEVTAPGRHTALYASFPLFGC